MISKLFSDAWGINRTMGSKTLLRWLGAIAATVPEVLRNHSLVSADRRMGPGPFKVRHPVAEALIGGADNFAGIREIWVRDVYGLGDVLKIADAELIVDLGSNVGNFSMLALAAAPNARLIAVEPNRNLIEAGRKQAAINGFADRIRYCRAFIGSFTQVQRDALQSDASAEAEIITEQEFLDRYDICHIDLLKCDIEGSEFALLEEGSRLLDISSQVAVEIHVWGGNVRSFLDGLEKKGFRILREQWDKGSCTALASRL